jgi:hypothetical protein
MGRKNWVIVLLTIFLSFSLQGQDKTDTSNEGNTSGQQINSNALIEVYNISGKSPVKSRLYPVAF